MLNISPQSTKIYKDLQITVGPFALTLKVVDVYRREMNKKYFVLMMLSLALSSQFSLAATVDEINPNTSAELKNNAKSNPA